MLAVTDFPDIRLKAAIQEALRQLVQTWIQSPADNHGLAGRITPVGSTCELVSSDGADGARPELVVEIEVLP